MGQLVFYAAIDAELTHNDLSATKTFHEIVTGAGTSYDDDGHSYAQLLWASVAAANKWRMLRRVGMVFNTAALPDTCTITGATLKIKGWAKSNGLVCSPNIGIYQFSPASEAALAATDYALFGTTVLSNIIAYADWPEDKSQATFTLNAAGLALINKTGNTCLGTRNTNYDVADALDPNNHDPAWVSNQTAALDMYGRNGEVDPHVPADGPTLTIDYTMPPPTVISILPSSGAIAGGTPVTITGTDFVNSATITIGGTSCTGVVFVNSTSLTANTPIGTVGAKDVVVTNPDTQFDTLAGGFTYVNTAIYAYVSAFVDNSLTILDVTDPTAPVFKSNIMGAGAPNFLSAPYDVVKQGDYCYCTCIGDACLTIIDVSNPAAPTFKSKVLLPAFSASIWVFVSGNYAYVVNNKIGGDIGLYIIDISNPAAPAIVGSILQGALTTGSQPIFMRAYKSGNYCYMGCHDNSDVTDTDNALLIIDVSDPTAPILTGSLRGRGAPNWIDCVFAFPSGNYCYCPIWPGGLTIVDISNPALPTFVSTISGWPYGAPNYLGGCLTAWKEGNYCYCSTYYNGLTVIDVSNPAAPTFVSNISPHPCMFFQKFGNYGYGGVGWDTPYDFNEVNVIDLSNPAAPAVVGSISGSGAPNYLNWPMIIAVEGSWTPAPTVVSILPASGTTAGGTAVTITGSEFISGATVTIDGVACTDVVFVNSTSITAKTPVGTVGAKDVVVINLDAQFDTLVGGFTYTGAPPSVPLHAGSFLARRETWIGGL